MARTALTKTNAWLKATDGDAGVALTETAADAVNKNSFVATGREVVIAHNTGASSHTVTITSAPDALGRTGDITSEAIAAGEIRLYGPIQLNGWQQTDGKVYLEANHAEVKFGVVVLP